MGKLSCAFTGHRPMRFSFGFDEESEKCRLIKAALFSQVAELIGAGVTRFYTGMSLGVDQWAASAVLDVKLLRPGVELIAVLPCETQADRWAVEQRERYFDTLARCDEVITLRTHYTPTCMHERNRYIVDRAEYLLAVYDGEARGGTAYTVRYAELLEREVRVIHPDTLEVTTQRGAGPKQLRRRLRVIDGTKE